LKNRWQFWQYGRPWFCSSADSNEGREQFDDLLPWRYMALPFLRLFVPGGASGQQFIPAHSESMSDGKHGVKGRVLFAALNTNNSP
jgi:hypothetical protein